MADNTTELEVLNQIVDVLGGQSGQYETVVPVLQQIYTLLEAGITDPEAIAEAVAAWLDEHPEATTTVQDGSITGVKIADDTIPDAKLAQTGGVLSTMNDLLGIEQVPHTIVNGTPQNSANNWAVQVSELIEVEYGDVIVVNPLVSPPSGYHFCFGFYAYTDTTRVTSFSHEWLDNKYSPNFYNVNYNPSGVSIVGIRVAIGLVNEDGAYSPLRASTFGADSVEVVKYKLGHALDGAELTGLLGEHDGGTENLGNYAVFGQNGLSGGVLGIPYFRVASDHLFGFDRAITLKAASGFRFGIHTFVNGAYSADSGWQTKYTVPANTTFKAVISRATEDFSERANVSEFVHAITFETAIGARVSALEGGSQSPYSYFGAPINTRKNGFTCDQLSWGPQANQTSSAAGQGFGIFGDTLFQCYAGGVVQLYDMTDGSKTAEYTLVGDHCDCVDFSNEYYDASDAYPLMYVTADTTPAVVYVNRVTASGATLVRTLRFPQADTGYYAGHAIDAISNRLYMIGYSENSYQSDPNGTNDMIVTKWNLDNLTSDGGVYTPEKLASFRIPFIYTAQGQCFFDGKIFIVSSLSAAVQQTRVYVIDPAAESIVAVITDLPSALLSDECEGVAFHLDGDEYEMILGTRTHYYSAKFA